MKELLQLRRDPPAGVFYRRNDPYDLRLGEVVKTKLDDYDQAEIVLLGCPQEEGVRRNQGRLGAKQAPTLIREQFYKLGVLGLSDLQLFDLGDTRTEGPLEEIHERQQALVQRVMRDGKRLIVLGGGNDI